MLKLFSIYFLLVHILCLLVNDTDKIYLKQFESNMVIYLFFIFQMHIGFKRRPGAIIESMQHHGKGVYSGTFSGKFHVHFQILTKALCIYFMVSYS